MLGQRRGRWANIKTTPAECIVFAGLQVFTGPPQQTQDVHPMVVGRMMARGILLCEDRRRYLVTAYK